MLFIPLTKKGMSVGPKKSEEDQKSSGLKFGRDFIFKKSVRIPARPFLTIRDSWLEQIYQYALERMVGAIVGGIK
jgi:phage gpG-like protein